MPIKPPRICPCGHRVAAADRCACQIKRAGEAKARFDHSRPNARARGYDAEWQKARIEYLRLNPTCRCPGCGAPATIVHHVEPHKGNTRLFWNKANWFPACKPCHDGPLQAQERRT